MGVKIYVAKIGLLETKSDSCDSWRVAGNHAGTRDRMRDLCVTECVTCWSLPDSWRPTSYPTTLWSSIEYGDLAGLVTGDLVGYTPCRIG